MQSTYWIVQHLFLAHLVALLDPFLRRLIPMLFSSSANLVLTCTGLTLDVPVKTPVRTNIHPSKH